MNDGRLPLLAVLIAAAASNGDPQKRDGFLSRLASQATGAVVDIVDPEKIVEQIDINALMDGEGDSPVVKLVNSLIVDAVKRGASDIHVEPFEHEIRVRYRIDGSLQEVMKPPAKLSPAPVGS